MNEDFITTFPSFAVTFRSSEFKVATDFQLFVKLRSPEAKHVDKSQKVESLLKMFRVKGVLGTRKTSFHCFCLFNWFWEILGKGGGSSVFQVSGCIEYNSKWVDP